MRVAVEAQPVVATFENLATYNPLKSKAGGRPIYDQQEVCRIRFAGNKHTVGVFPAHEPFKHEPGPEGILEPVTYAMEYSDAYHKFKDGEAQTVAGTPLGELPFLTQAKRLELKALNIHTAETLAALDGAALRTLGMGGRDLKNQAAAYLETAAGTRDAAMLHDALEIRDQEIAALRDAIARLEGGGNASGAPAVLDAKPSPFDDFTADDLTNWIKDADPTAKVDGRWAIERLRAVAQEINDRLVKKAAA